MGGKRKRSAPAAAPVGGDAKKRRLALAKAVYGASFAGHIARLRALLASHAPLDYVRPDGSTALRAAAARGHVVTVLTLLAAASAVSEPFPPSAITDALLAASSGSHTLCTEALLGTADAGDSRVQAVAAEFGRDVPSPELEAAIREAAKPLSKATSS